MKIGDLVKCMFQPRVGGYDFESDRLLVMEYVIKGEMGLIIDINQHYYRVLFPQFGYAHQLAANTLEVISETR
jgi:hypothetical protein